MPSSEPREPKSMLRELIPVETRIRLEQQRHEKAMRELQRELYAVRARRGGEAP